MSENRNVPRARFPDPARRTSKTFRDRIYKNGDEDQNGIKRAAPKKCRTAVGIRAEFGRRFFSSRMGCDFAPLLKNLTCERAPCAPASRRNFPQIASESAGGA